MGGQQVYLYLSSRSYIVAELGMCLGVLKVLEVFTALLWPTCLVRSQNPQGSGAKKIRHIRRRFLAQALGRQLVAPGARRARHSLVLPRKQPSQSFHSRDWRPLRKVIRPKASCYVSGTALPLPVHWPRLVPSGGEWPLE